MIPAALRHGLPDPRDLPRLVVRGAALWLAVRIGVAVVMMMSPGLKSPGRSILDLAPPAAAAVVLIVAVGAAGEARRARETLFAANLGRHPAGPSGVAAAVAAVLELGTSLVV